MDVCVAVRDILWCPEYVPISVYAQFYEPAEFNCVEQYCVPGLSHAFVFDYCICVMFAHAHM